MTATVVQLLPLTSTKGRLIKAVQFNTMPRVYIWEQYGVKRRQSALKTVSGGSGFENWGVVGPKSSTVGGAYIALDLGHRPRNYLISFLYISE